MLRRIRKTVGRILVGFLLLLVAVVLISALSNLGLSGSSRVVDRLDDDEKALIAEAIHLRKNLGEEIWPGWEVAEIPVLVYNESFAFLVGLEQPADGWYKPPRGPQRGAAWELVPGDNFYGQPYYRQSLPNAEITPEAFTVKVGDHWVASFPTKEWLEISLRQQMQSDLPSFLRPLVPYRLVLRLFLKGSDGYMAGLLHESFHAFQGLVAPGRLNTAELSANEQADRYPFQDEAMVTTWQADLDVLVAALQAANREERAAMAAQFLSQRDNRRKQLSISPAQQDFERQREWLEGLARYAELGVWRVGGNAETYLPLAAAEQLSDYSVFAAHIRRWSEELDTMVRMADDPGDGRFYYSGMAQAMLLDSLLPGWKERAFQLGVFLEDLLRASLVEYSGYLSSEGLVVIIT